MGVWWDVQMEVQWDVLDDMGVSILSAKVLFSLYFTQHNVRGLTLSRNNRRI